MKNEINIKIRKIANGYILSDDNVVTKEYDYYCETAGEITNLINGKIAKLTL